MKTYRVFLTDTANGDLRDIAFHILDQSKERDGYRYLVHKDYLVFYRIQGENVYVEGIFNAKKDYMRVLKRII